MKISINPRLYYIIRSISKKDNSIVYRGTDTWGNETWCGDITKSRKYYSIEEIENVISNLIVTDGWKFDYILYMK